MNAIRLPFLSFLLACLTACAQIGLPTPDTVPQKIMVAVASVTSVRDAAATLLANKKLSADDADNILKQTDNLRAGLDVARALARTDPRAADAKLTAIRTTLIALQAYLDTKGKSP